MFIKIYLYGYLNKVRSGRRLEKECIREMEMQWLSEERFVLITTAYPIFKKNNPTTLKKLFKLYVLFLKDADLIGCETISIDGTKSRVHNSKKAIFNQKKIDKHVDYIEIKIKNI